VGGGAAARALGEVKRLVLLVVLAGVLAPAATAAPLEARAGFDDVTVQFGDRIHTRISVVVDASVRAGSVRVVDDPAPLTTLSLPRMSRVGNVIEVTRDAICVTSACVSDTGSATPKLAPVLVRAKLTNGRPVQVVVQWPQLTVRGRVTGGDLGRSEPPFRASLLPPAATFRTPPSTLAWLLDAAAIVLGLRRARAAARPELDARSRAFGSGGRPRASASACPRGGTAPAAGSTSRRGPARACARRAGRRARGGSERPRLGGVTAEA
jgi:hypothetical protein